MVACLFNWNEVSSFWAFLHRDAIQRGLQKHTHTNKKDRLNRVYREKVWKALSLRQCSFLLFSSRVCAVHGAETSATESGAQEEPAQSLLLLLPTRSQEELHKQMFYSEFQHTVRPSSPLLTSAICKISTSDELQLQTAGQSAVMCSASSCFHNWRFWWLVLKY